MYKKTRMPIAIFPLLRPIQMVQFIITFSCGGTFRENLAKILGYFAAEQVTPNI
jgi:hypothetical protein